MKDLATGRVEITSQNHGFAVDADPLAASGWEISHVNLNDGTCEGLRHREVQPRDAVRRRVRGVAARFEVIVEIRRDCGIVFDDEDAHETMRGLRYALTGCQRPSISPCIGWK